MIAIKIGGSVVDALHSSFISDLKTIPGAVLIHGGGKEVTKVSSQLGKEAKFVTSPSGIKSRYTDAETAEIFTMVMSGRIGKRIVLALQKQGINAVGLSGIDGRCITADRKKRLLIVNERGRKQAIDGGYTGKISGVNRSLIQKLLDCRMTPVISPIAISEEHEPLNVDGDRAAAHVAGAIGAEKVIFITNVDGLLLDGKLVARLTLKEAKDARPKAGAGMEKKILAATEALEMGVSEALIANGKKENPIASAISHNNCTVISND